MNWFGYSQQEMFEKYMEQGIETNHPIENTILMYKKLKENFSNAKTLSENFQYKAAFELLEKNEQILDILMLQLNPETKELSEELFDLYEWLNNINTQAKRTYTFAELENAYRVLNDLIEGYEEVLKHAE